MNMLGALMTGIRRFKQGNLVGRTLLPSTLGMSQEAIQPNDFDALVNAYRSWSYICINMNATTVAQQKLKLYVAKQQGQKIIGQTRQVEKKVKDYLFTHYSHLNCVTKAVDIEQVTEHPFLDLMKNVNNFMNRFDLWETTQMFLELTGNSYWYVINNNLGTPVELWILPAHNVVIVPDEKTFIKGYIYKKGWHDLIPFKEEEVIHFKFANPHNVLYGMSPLAGVAYAHDINYNMNRYEMAVFKNGGRLEGAFETDESIREEDFERLKAELHQSFGSAEAAAGISPLLDKGVKYKSYGLSPRELNFLAGRKITREEILGAFNVPLSKVTTGDVNRCHDETTETLTDKGWKKYNEITDNDKIATYNKEKKCLEYQLPINRYIYDYNGDMLYMKNSLLDLCVTPNHRMFISSNVGHEKIWGDWEFRKAQDLPKYFRQIQAINNYEGKEEKEILINGVKAQSYKVNNESDITYNMDLFLEFVGYIISEGGLLTKGKQDNHYVGTLSQKKVENVKKIDDCLMKLNIKNKKYKTSDGVTRWNLASKRLITWLINNTGTDCYDKNIPKCFMNLSKRQLKILLDALVLGDGSIDKRENRNSFYYATVSKKLANDVMEICIKLGYRVNYQERTDKRLTEKNNLRANCFYVHISHEKYVSFRRTNSNCIFEYKKYTGKVFSFEVPNHIYITKRNGRVSINGNSNADAGERQYYKDGILPRLTRIEEKINEKMTPRYDDNIFTAFDNPVPEDKEFMLKERESNLGANITTLNEERNKMGLDKFEGGDIRYQPFNLVPRGSSTGIPPGQEPPSEEVEAMIASQITEKVLSELRKGIRI